MDREQFDRLARVFATRHSRRATLVALAGSLIFGREPDDAPAERRKRRKGRQQNGAERSTGAPLEEASAHAASVTEGDTREETPGRAVAGGPRGGAAAGPAGGRRRKRSRKKGKDRDNGKRRRQRKRQQRRQDRDAPAPSGSCRPIGEACEPGGGESCCGGASCVDGRCACPGHAPHDCGGACQVCCADAHCPDPGKPHCCADATCQACCSDEQCPSNICCANACCADNQVCDTRSDPPSCCQPEPPEALCAGRACGAVTDRCGQTIDCGQCAPRTCQAATCVDGAACEYASQPDNAPGTNCATVCCHGACCDSGQVCDTRGATPVCCTPRTTCPANACGAVPDGCGGTVACGPCAPRTCETGTCGADHQCAYALQPDNRPGTGCASPGFCCNGACCDSRQVCYQNTCCTPDPETVTCAGKCGTVIDNCGRTVTCPTVCQNPAPICGSDNICRPCASHEECGPDAVCCDGSCVSGICCAASDCTPFGNICDDAQCYCGSQPACPGNTPYCCGAFDPVCTDIDFDPNHCGACENPCPRAICHEAVCTWGECDLWPVHDQQGIGCDTDGRLCCDGMCRIITGDPQHCGACGNACAANAPDCLGGSCRCRANGNLPCPASQVCCSTGCKEIETDPANCGACGRTCPAGICQVATCSGGACGTVPAHDRQTPGCAGAGVRCCNGSCRDILSDPRNCGSCGNVCDTGVCSNGACAPCTSDAHCGAGRVCCGGACLAGACCTIGAMCEPVGRCCVPPNVPSNRVCCTNRAGSGAGKECCLLSGHPLAQNTPCSSNGQCCSNQCVNGHCQGFPYDQCPG